MSGLVQSFIMHENRITEQFGIERQDVGKEEKKNEFEMNLKSPTFFSVQLLSLTPQA